MMIQNSFCIECLCVIIFSIYHTSADTTERQRPEVTWPSSYSDYNPKDSIGRLIWYGSAEKRLMLTYDLQPCFATAIKPFWVITSCACASVIDGEFIPQDTFKEADDHTKLIGIYESYFYEYRHDLPSPPHPANQWVLSRSPIILVVRHPKCQIKRHIFRHNVAIIRLMALVFDLPLRYGRQWKEINRGNNLVYNEFKLRAHNSACYAWFADPETLKVTKCKLWGGPHDITPFFDNISAPKWNVNEDGNLCIQNSSCRNGKYAIGLPITCTQDEFHKGYGVISGPCYNCKDLHMYFFIEMMQPDTHFRSIDTDWKPEYVITRKQSDHSPKFVWFEVPDANVKTRPAGKSSYPATSHNSILIILIQKIFAKLLDFK